MVILHYIPSIDHSSGGVGAYIQLVARDLGRLCDLHILTHASASELKLENCTVHYMPYKWLPWNNCKKEFLQVLDEVRPDVFHSNSCWMPVSALTAIWAKKEGYKVVYTPHGMLEPWCMTRNRWKKIPATWLFQRKGLQVCDMIHATSEMEKQNLLRLGWNKQVCMVPNCVQVDQILMKQSWQRTKTILYLSRIHPKKAIPFLIEAVAAMKDQLEGYRVRIVGDGELAYREQLIAQTRAKGVEDIIRFEPPVFGDAKWQLFAESDLFVLPTYSENFGIVVVEALASGTPVITTQGTPWNELETCGCGWWTEIGAKPLADALHQFLQLDEETLHTMGRKGRELIERKYSSTAVAEQFRELYEQLA